MDAPPAKRRRTSPRLSARSDEAEPDASSQAPPPQQPPQPPPPSSSQTQSRIPRPSFASPTRASLARHNPAVLDRRQSLPRSSQTGGGGGGVDDEAAAATTAAAAAVADEEGGGDRLKSPAPGVRPLAQSPMRSPVRLASPTRALAMPPVRSPNHRRASRSPSRSPTRRLFGSTTTTGGGLFAAPPQQSPKAMRQSQPQLQEQQELGSAANVLPDKALDSIPGSLLGALPRRSPIKPVPRPLPPPDPQRSEDILEPLIARDKRLRSGLDMFRVPEEPAPEPELPPTPSHPSPDLTTSPTGIHGNAHQSSTPTKRPKRVGRLRGSAKNNTNNSSSSPLKQPLIGQKDAAAAAQDGGNGPEGAADTGPTKAPRKTAAGHPSQQHGQPQATEPQSTGVRNIKPFDPDAARKKERDSLLAEIVALEADLALVAAETTRLREAAEEQSGSSSSSSSSNSIPTAPNASDIINLLRRRALPEDDDDDDADNSEETITANWLQMAANPIAFLPFGKPRANIAEVVQLFAGGRRDEDQEDQPLPTSHHPIAMSAADELPFLQAFSPLAFHSQIFAAAAESADTTLFQKHVITARSTAPPGVFMARIEMTVHATSLKIVDLQVPRIEPPEARVELQPLLDRVTTKTATTTTSTATCSALVGNVTVLSWALGEWVRVAVRRAKFWAALARLLRNKAAGMADAVRALRSRAKRASRAQKRSRGDGHGDGNGDNNDDDNDGDSDNDEADADPIGAVSKREVLEHIGRRGMEVDIPALFRPANKSSSSSHSSKNAAAAAAAAAMTGLRVEWDIDFDWTGEATSKLRLLVGVPGTWRKADKKGSLGKLPRLFDQLAHDGRDPMRAVQTAVALLAGEEGLEGL